MAVDDLTRRRSGQLAAEGYRHLEEGNAEEALAVATKLEGMQFTAAFEIAALAQVQLGDLGAAVTTLERGLEIAPGVWINWQLLGNYLSDLERFDEAARAYEKALACADVHESSIRLNQAILAKRQDLNDQALAFVDQVTDPDLAIRAAGVRVDALAGAGRPDEALRAGEAALSGCESDDAESLGYLAASMVRARRHQGASAQEIFGLALAALDEHDRSNPGLLALIRDADNQYSATAKYFRLTIDAKIPFTDPRYVQTKGYVVNYDVVADSLEEALDFVRRMEAPVHSGNLLVDEHEVLVDPSQDPKGVYKRTARHYYETEN
jgi:tetratricopeptide (TPR) repeat protein